MIVCRRRNRAPCYRIRSLASTGILIIDTASLAKGHTQGRDGNRKSPQRIDRTWQIGQGRSQSSRQRHRRLELSLHRSHHPLRSHSTCIRSTRSGGHQDLGFSSSLLVQKASLGFLDRFHRVGVRDRLEPGYYFRL